MIGVITCKSFTKENRQNILHCEIPFLDLNSPSYFYTFDDFVIWNYFLTHKQLRPQFFFFFFRYKEGKTSPYIAV